MCAPILMTGLQLATSLASGASQSAQLKYEAKLAAREAQSQARQAAASAEFKRATASAQTATERATVFANGTDPKSESSLGALAQHHAIRLDPALNDEFQARLALDRGAIKSRNLKRAASSALTRSILSSGGLLIDAGFGGNSIRIPD